MSQRHPGQTRIKLAAALEKLLRTEFPDVCVEPEDIWEQQGYWRHGTVGVARWGAYFTDTRTKLRYHLSSWDTMGESVHKGVVFVGDPKEDRFNIEVSVK